MNKGGIKLAAAKKRTGIEFKGRPLKRCGNRLYYGNLNDKCILVLDVLETEDVKGTKVTKKVKFSVMDNTGEFGKGKIYRSSERDNLYKALDFGEVWLKGALSNMG